MKIPRRTFLHLAWGAVALPVLARAARAQTYPSRPVRLIVGFAAGGPTDLQARIMADLLSARWGGKPVIVENRPGAGTILATAAVAKAPPDGYTFLLTPAQFVINAAIGQKLPYDPLSDFTPIGTIMDAPTVLVANKSFTANTIPELVKLAKQATVPINFASPGPRGSAHLTGEMLQQRAGIKMQHINYNGSAPALSDVIGGRVPLMFDPWQSSKSYVESGQLKLIATATPDRLRDAPQVPTIGESYFGFAVSSFTFLIGPAGVPEPIVQMLSADVRAIVESAEFAAKAKQLGVDPKGTGSEELRIILRMEIEKWTEVAKAANITAE